MDNNFNIFNFFYEFFFKLIEYAKIIWNFLNRDINLNTTFLPEIGLIKNLVEWITGSELPTVISFSLIDIISNPIFIIIMILVVIFT